MGVGVHVGVSMMVWKLCRLMMTDTRFPLEGTDMTSYEANLVRGESGVREMIESGLRIDEVRYDNADFAVHVVGVERNGDVREAGIVWMGWRSGMSRVVATRRGRRGRRRRWGRDVGNSTMDETTMLDHTVNRKRVISIQLAGDDKTNADRGEVKLLRVDNFVNNSG